MYALLAIPFVGFLAILVISLSEIVDFRARPLTSSYGRRLAFRGAVIGITGGAIASLLARLF